jgi:hypothetical protein
LSGTDNGLAHGRLPLVPSAASAVPASGPLTVIDAARDRGGFSS